MIGRYTLYSATFRIMTAKILQATVCTSRVVWTEISSNTQLLRFIHKAKPKKQSYSCAQSILVNTNLHYNDILPTKILIATKRYLINSIKPGLRE
jgi:hypothetical protein